MPHPLNEAIGNRLEEVAQLLSEQGANQFRTEAYRRAAQVVRQSVRPMTEIYASDGLQGLESLPGIGPSIGRSIRDLVLHGRLAMLDRLRGEHDPIALLRSVPGIGRILAEKLHDDLGLDSLAGLEAAAYDGRLETLAGFGSKRLAGIRDTLAQRLGRLQKPPYSTSDHSRPPVAELLDVDAEYRRGVARNSLKKIVPRRFNPAHEALLPVLHTSRGPRHYTAFFSNTARAHERGKNRDWVILYYDGDHEEQQSTIITGEFGRLKGRRLVRGRENECEILYRANSQSPEKLAAYPRTRTERGRTTKKSGDRIDVGGDG